jgi:predicted DsbA family dithiol-disulfide isomerase
MDIAAQTGLEKEKVEACLTDDDARIKVKIAETAISKLGISGVPFYIINNKVGVSGAQLPETFIKAFEEIGLSIPTGESCDVNEKNC